MEGLALARRGGLRNAVIHGSAGLIRLRLAQGDLDSAREAASQFVLDAQAGQIPHFIRWAAAMQALVDLRCGDLSAATRWAHSSQPRPDALMFTDKAAFAVYMRVLLAMGQTDEARRCIAQQRAYIAPYDHVETQVELHLLDTLALIIVGERNAARAALESALALAEPAGLMRLFLDAGEPVMALLAQHPPEGSRGTFVARLLHTGSNFGLEERSPIQKRKSPGQNRLDPLSDRELEVLGLIAEGLSNQAIADRLYISVPTVKKHGSNIFDKLYSANRTEAVARARALGLLL